MNIVNGVLSFVFILIHAFQGVIVATEFFDTQFEGFIIFIMSVIFSNQLKSNY